MDGPRFDRLTRRLATGTTRRAALGVLVGGLFGLALEPDSADARRRRRRRRRPRTTNEVACSRLRGQACSQQARCCGPYVCGSNGNPLRGPICCSQNGLPCRTPEECCGNLVCNPASNTCV